MLCLTFLTVANMFFTDLSPLLTLFFIAFQYPQLNLSQLLKSSWVRTGMFNLCHILGTVKIRSL